jgi:hypothetical protein
MLRLLSSELPLVNSRYRVGVRDANESRELFQRLIKSLTWFMKRYSVSTAKNRNYIPNNRVGVWMCCVWIDQPRVTGSVRLILSPWLWRGSARGIRSTGWDSFIHIPAERCGLETICAVSGDEVSSMLKRYSTVLIEPNTSETFQWSDMKRHKTKQTFLSSDPYIQQISIPLLSSNQTHLKFQVSWYYQIPYRCSIGLIWIDTVKPFHCCDLTKYLDKHDEVIPLFWSNGILCRHLLDRTEQTWQSLLWSNEIWIY